jgi:tRNA A-37 threonylcarbamoyl transferase component Bud32
MTAESFDDLTASAELIVADKAGPKVMQLDNGNMIKLFRRKRLISSALFAPYAVRFCNNAFRLKELHIPTITPVEIHHCQQRQMHLVEYEPLPGELLRGRLQTGKDNALFVKTAKFIAELHNKGVYFRSLHFENIVYHDGRLGLIDIADMKIYRKPLGKSLQQRNFQHFMRYPADAELINNFGFQQFETAYRQALQASGPD